MPFRWNRGKLLCARCPLNFNDITSLREHALGHPSTSALPMSHKQNSSDFVKIDISDLKCNICFNDIANLHELRIHLVTEHFKPLNLEISDGLIPFCLKGDEYTCVHCGVVFVTFMKLMMHMNSHYERHICDCCGRGFSSQTQLRKHKYAHKKGEFSCSICLTVFKNRSLRNNHVAQAHSTDNRYKCPQCTETFPTYVWRVKHMKEVHDVKMEYPCPMCPAVFITCNYRNKHVKHTHIKEKTHLCAECPSTFVTYTQLKNHMIKHSGERNFQCTYCLKKYTRRKTLEDHIRVHTNEKRFACTICSEAFVQKYGLQQHMLVHQPTISDVPYDYC